MTDHFERPASSRYAWEDQHTRTEIVHTVLTRAALDPASPDLFSGIPELDRLFGGPAGLLQALYYRWKIHLEVKLEEAMSRGQSAVEAYLELAAEQPALRAVLDAYTPRRTATAAMAR